MFSLRLKFYSGGEIQFLKLFWLWATRCRDWSHVHHSVCGKGYFRAAMTSRSVHLAPRQTAARWTYDLADRFPLFPYPSAGSTNYFCLFASASRFFSVVRLPCNDEGLFASGEALVTHIAQDTIIQNLYTNLFRKYKFQYILTITCSPIISHCLIYNLELTMSFLLLLLC